MKIWCCHCNEDVDAALVTGGIVYPHRPDLNKKNFYICPKCNNFVGCHPNSDKPLGCIPTRELKQARIKVHNKMDPLWKSGRMTRKSIYSLLSQRLGYTYHNGETKSVEECNKAYNILEEIEHDIR